MLRKLPLLSKDEDSFDLIDFKRDQAILRDDLPMFEVDWNEPKEPKVYGLPLEKFITELFLHHYRLCNNVFLSPEQTIHIDILAYRCWSCGCPWDLYKLSSDSSYVIDIHGKEHGQSCRVMPGHQSLMMDVKQQIIRSFLLNKIFEDIFLIISRSVHNI